MNQSDQKENNYLKSSDYLSSISRTIDLNNYLGIKEVVKFINDEVDYLSFNLINKSNLIYNILNQSKTWNQASERFDYVQVEHNQQLFRWLKEHFKLFKNATDNLDWWTKNFNLKKFFAQEVTYFLDFQFSQKTNYFFKQPRIYYLLTDFAVSKTNPNLAPLPLFFTPIYFTVDTNFDVVIKKLSPDNFFYNSELIHSKFLPLKLPDFSNNQLPSTFNRQEAIRRLMIDNDLQKRGYSISNDQWEILPIFKIANLNHNFFNVDWERSLEYHPEQYKVKTKDEALVQPFSLELEKKMLDISVSKKIYYHALAWLNRKNLEQLFFQAVWEERRILLVSSSYDVLMDYFILSQNRIKELVFFNYDYHNNEHFFNQFKVLAKYLKPVLTETLDNFAIGEMTPYVSLEVNDLSNLQNYQALYKLKSISPQLLDDSLRIMNENVTNNQWSEWTKIAFKYCIDQNLNLTTLIKKAKLIAELNETYAEFLNQYSYKEFWTRVSDHEKFLEEYDHTSVLKVLYYLWLYIRDKEMPKKVRFFSLSESEYSQSQLIFIYKLFYSAAYYRLFYIKPEELTIILNQELHNYKEFLALSNEKWLKQTNEYSFFIKSDNYNQTFDHAHNPDHYWQNIDSLINNYFLDLKQRVNAWNNEKKRLLQALFTNVSNRSYWNKINLFIADYWDVIKELFPVFVFYNNDNYLLQKFYNQTNFHQTFWFIGDNNSSLLKFILERKGNDVALINGANENTFGIDSRTITDLISLLKPEKYWFDQNINQKSRAIARILAPKSFQLDYNCIKKFDEHLGISSFCVDADFIDGINHSVLKAALEHLNNELPKYWYQRNVILVKNQTVKEHLLAILLENHELLVRLRQANVMIYTLDDKINFWIDHLIIVFNDLIGIWAKMEFVRSFYNQNYLDQKILHFLSWTKQAVTNFISLNTQNITNLRNKKNREVLENLLEPKNPPAVDHEENQLIEMVNEEILTWLSNNLDAEKYEPKLVSIGLKQRVLKIIDHDNFTVLLIKLFHNNINYEQNLAITKSFINQSYQLIDLFVYDWFYKKTQIQDWIMEKLCS